MPFFGSTTLPFDKEIEQLTDVNNTTEDWSLILNICDKAVNYSDGPKFILKSIIKRMLHNDPHVSMQALTLLDACVNNCGKTFHLEMCNRAFISDIRKLLSKGHPKVTEKMKLLIRTWSEDIFKEDPKLCLIPALYYKLRSEGVEFPDVEPPPEKQKVSYSTDPNVVSSQQEEDDIAKAIEISLNETTAIKSNSFRESASAFTGQSIDIQEPSKVRALYDFEAVEGNELTLKAGEIVILLDCSDENWWRGSNHRGEGLFPANFVTKDLNAKCEILEEISDTTSNKVVAEVHQEQNVVEINEDKINKVLQLLDDADPTGEIPDFPEMSILEAECHEMSPLIDKELQIIDKKLSRLRSLNTKIVEAVTQFHEFSRQSATANLYYPQYPPSQMMITENQQSYPLQFPGQISSDWSYLGNVMQNASTSSSTMGEQPQAASLITNPINLSVGSTVLSSRPPSTSVSSPSEMAHASASPVQFDVRNVPLMPNFGPVYQPTPVPTSLTPVPNYYMYAPPANSIPFTTQNLPSVTTSSGTHVTASNLAPSRTNSSNSSALFSTPSFDLITGNLTSCGEYDKTVPLMCKVVSSSATSSKPTTVSQYATETVKENVGSQLSDTAARHDSTSSTNRDVCDIATSSQYSYYQPPVSAESNVPANSKPTTN